MNPYKKHNLQANRNDSLCRASLLKNNNSNIKSDIFNVLVFASILVVYFIYLVYISKFPEKSIYIIRFTSNIISFSLFILAAIKNRMAIMESNINAYKSIKLSYESSSITIIAVVFSFLTIIN